MDPMGAGAGAQHHERGLVADLEARPRNDGHPPLERPGHGGDDRRPLRLDQGQHRPEDILHTHGIELFLQHRAELWVVDRDIG